MFNCQHINRLGAIVDVRAYMEEAKLTGAGFFWLGLVTCCVSLGALKKERIWSHSPHDTRDAWRNDRKWRRILLSSCTTVRRMIVKATCKRAQRPIASLSGKTFFARERSYINSNIIIVLAVVNAKNGKRERKWVEWVLKCFCTSG